MLECNLIVKHFVHFVLVIIRKGGYSLLMSKVTCIYWFFLAY